MLHKAYAMIGLAKKAGKLFSGDDTCSKLISGNKVYLVIIAEDASGNTLKKFSDMCQYKNIQYRIFGIKESIGKYCGKYQRAVVVVTDKSFSERIKELIDITG